MITKEFKCVKCGYTFHLKKGEVKPSHPCTMCKGTDFADITEENIGFDGAAKFDKQTGEYLLEGDFVSI